MAAVAATKLDKGFYQRENVVRVGRELLGKVVATRIDGVVTRAIITETEAYAGVTDRASHAFGGRRTRRTEPIFGPGGVAYVYLCYGIHHLFNVVTGKDGVPHAVLVRGGRPLEGTATMLARRRKKRQEAGLLSGPGNFSAALGIVTTMTGTDLGGERIWLEDHGIRVRNVESGPRIGVDYAGADAFLPYRFVAGSLS